MSSKTSILELLTKQLTSNREPISGDDTEVSIKVTSLTPEAGAETVEKPGEPT